MYNILHQSKWTEKTFQQPRSSPTLPALSDMMERSGQSTTRIVSARPETHVEWWTTFGSHPSTAPRPNQDCARAVCFPLYCTARNSGGWRSVTWTSCPPSIQRTSEGSCVFSSLRLSRTNNFSPAATKRAWRPSSCEGDGDGSDMSPAESRAASQAEPSKRKGPTPRD